MGLVSELRRRNVFRVALAYILVAWLTLQVGDTLAPALRLPDWINTALAFFLILGFPLAIFFAWAYELTPEGIKLEQHIDRSQSITHLTGRKLDYIIIAVLALALGYFVFDKFVLDASREAELVQTTTEAVTEQVANTATSDNSIAVLPFADMSPDGDQEYFSDGISEELLNALSKIPGLRVAARTSSFQFKGESRDIIDIGKQLNVAHILEGSVRKSGNQLRITAQLIKADDGFHLWSDTYDRELENIFALQDEISTAIVGALKEHLGFQISAPPRVAATPSTEAYEAYLRGRYLVVQRTKVSLEGAVREFEKAIALDPDYALAHAELAFCFIALRRDAYGSLTDTEAIARAAPYAERAMALDPTLAEAHYVTGSLSRIQGNVEQAVTHYEQAIQLNPNFARAYLTLGAVMDMMLGRYDEGFAMYEKALRLDPLSLPTRGNYARGLLDRNRLVEAKREIEKLAAISPRKAAEIRRYRMALGGNWANLILSQLDAFRIDPNGVSWALLEWLGINFAIIGLEKEALAISDAKRPHRFVILRRHGEAVKTAEASLAEDPSDVKARRRLGMALASGGEYERARPILEEVWKHSGGLIENNLITADCAAALITIRRDADEEAQVGELIAAIRDNVRRYREADITSGQGTFWDPDYEEGLAAYLAGEHERGLALISNAVEGGFFIMPWEAYLQELYDDPGFAPIRATQEARQVREREKFLSIVCNDNPYEAVWQPAEGTCEQFAAAQTN